MVECSAMCEASYIIYMQVNYNCFIKMSPHSSEQTQFIAESEEEP